ncbi:PREDICTED: vasculin-like, partial [Acanthisitta chloris]|uniref:vasculin-like n=1 Tax=Acanthisitta chloris TaxID=57068 RepID=UPI0004F0D1F3
YLRSTTCASLQSSLNFEKRTEKFPWAENRYEANCREQNSSDQFDANIGWTNAGHLGRKERNSWRSQGRNIPETPNHREGYHGGGSRTRTSTFYCGRSQGLHENSVPANGTRKQEDNEVPKHFKAEDFPSLNPEYERDSNRNKSLAAGVWEYPLNPKPRSQRTLVITNSSAKERVSGFQAVGSLHSQPVRNGTGTSVYKTLAPKPVTLPTKPTQWKSQAKENKRGNAFPYESVYGVCNSSPFTSTVKAFTATQNPVRE